MWEPNLQLCREFIKAGIGLNGNSKLHTKRDGYHSRDRGLGLNARMLGKSEQTSENVKWVSCVFILMILGVWVSEWLSQARICAYYMQNMWRRWRNDKKRIFRISQAGCKIKSVSHQHSLDGFGWVYKCYHYLGVWVWVLLGVGCCLWRRNRTEFSTQINHMVPSRK